MPFIDSKITVPVSAEKKEAIKKELGIPGDKVYVEYRGTQSYCQLLWIEKKCLFHQAAFICSPYTKIIFLATSSSCLNPLSRRQFFSA